MFFLLLLFAKGTDNHQKQSLSDEIKVHIEFIVYYKDGFSQRFGVDVDVPKGTTFKKLPGLLNEKSLCEHYSVRFFEENGDIIPGIKTIINGKFLEDDAKEIVLEPKYSIKFIFQKDEDHSKEL